MAYDTSQLVDPENGDVVAVVITSAKAVASKRKEDEPPSTPLNVYLQLAAQIMEGPAEGYTIFDRIMLVNAKEPSKTAGWMRNAAARISRMTGMPVGLLPTEPGEETDTIQALPGTTFEAVVKVSFNEKLNRKDVSFDRILGPIEI